eukprot:9216024-Lingulodinium_polyedra.AAC.1
MVEWFTQGTAPCQKGLIGILRCVLPLRASASSHTLSLLIDCMKYLRRHDCDAKWPVAVSALRS